MQYAATPTTLRAAGKFLVAGNNVTGDWVLKTFVLAMRRLGVTQEFDLGSERAGNGTVNRLVCIGGA